MGESLSMDKPQAIGILGGMGPEATILLQRKLMEAVPAQDDSDHIPLLIDMNTQVPSRIAHLIEGTGDDPSPVLSAMALRLQDAGAAALAMPCNTAHHYAKAITDTVSIPLLNMVEVAATHAADVVGKGGSVGMLGSPAVRKTKLFENAMTAHNINVIWPKHDDCMLDAIRMIKSDGPCAGAREIMLVASNELDAAGADLQFIACSEFSLIVDSVAPNAKIVDTVDLLVDAILAFSTAS